MDHRSRNRHKLQELANRGLFEELDAKLSKELDKIMQGDFKKRIQVKETEYSKRGEMLTGRQITWLLYDNFKISDTDGVMLEWDAIMQVEPKGDNLAQFVSDWETTLLNINGMPEEKILESVFRKQLMQNDQLKNAMALHDQDVNIRGVKRSYEGLLRMVNLVIDTNRLNRSKAALDKVNNAGLYPAAKPKVKPNTCRQWQKNGKCSRSDGCS